VSRNRAGQQQVVLQPRACLYAEYGALKPDITILLGLSVQVHEARGKGLRKEGEDDMRSADWCVILVEATGGGGGVGGQGMGGQGGGRGGDGEGGESAQEALSLTLLHCGCHRAARESRS
jgi:hypothetical protein